MKLFISRIIPEAGLQILREAGCQIEQYSLKQELPKEELIRFCQNNDALLSVGGNHLDQYFLESCKHLKGIALMSAGYDQVDLLAASALKIPVSNTPGVLSAATADTAFLLMLAISRNAFYMHNSIARGEWGFYEPTANLGIELYGKTLGIFGMGKIGLNLAQKCQAAYGMRIIYHNRKPADEKAASVGARYVPFEKLLEESDVLSVHANLSPQTKGLFDHAAFSRMKPSAIFINTARGSMHNETDLLQALLEKKIWGAGLDVTHPEPMATDHPLLRLPNVCILPHIGSATVETRNKMAIMAALNVLAALQGKPMPQALNPEVYA